MRALRKLRTYWRQQAVFEVVMEKDDEIRAMRFIMRTLAKLSTEGARRVLKYTMDRYGTVDQSSAKGADPRPLPQASGRE